MKKYMKYFKIFIKYKKNKKTPFEQKNLIHISKTKDIFYNYFKKYVLTIEEYSKKKLNQNEAFRLFQGNLFSIVYNYIISYDDEENKKDIMNLIYKTIQTEINVNHNSMFVLDAYKKDKGVESLSMFNNILKDDIAYFKFSVIDKNEEQTNKDYNVFFDFFDIHDFFNEDNDLILEKMKKSYHYLKTLNKSDLNNICLYLQLKQQSLSLFENQLLIIFENQMV